MEEKTEKFYTAESGVVKNVPFMLQMLAVIYAVMLALATVLVNRRVFADGD